MLLSHLGLAGVSVDVPLMVGPGGTAWDLSRGEAAWADAPLNGGVTLADDDRVLHLGERRATLYDDEGTVRNSWRIPLFPETATENLLQTVRTGGGEEAEITNEVAEAAWLGSQVALLTLEGEAALVDVATGELLQRFESVQYEETDGWPGLLPHRRRGVWLRDGEGGLLLPEGSILPDPGEEVEALCPAGRDLIRAVGDRLERLGEDGQVAWTTPMMAHLLALGRHLFVASGDDLVLLDPESGTVRRRAKGGLADMEGFAATSDGHLWAWGGTEGPAAVRCLDGDTGAHRRSWEIPADGVVTSSGSAWIWTDDGMLVQLAR